MVIEKPTTGSRGISKAREIYQDRSRRVKELKEEGERIIGYIDIFPVLEMLTALDLVPYCILGDINEPVTKADACLPTMVCPFLRSVLDSGLKGKYDFLDGVVLAHTCEVAEKMAHIWRIYVDSAYLHFIDTPHTTHPAALKHFKDLLNDFKHTLESIAGKKLSTEKLRPAIKLHNRQRALMRQLYDLRKPTPPLISGAESVLINIALVSLPVEEGNELLRQVIDEVKQRQNGPTRQPARLLVWGSIIDNTALFEMIESLGASVVIDDTSMGSRAYMTPVEITEDPLDGLAYHYLVDLRSPRTFRETVLNEAKRKDYITDLENRFSHLREYAGE